MKLSSEEEAKLRKPRNGHAISNPSETLEFLRQAAVSYDLLTNSPEWDYFLSHLKHWIEVTEASAATFRAALESPSVDDATAKRARMDLLLCNERSNILKAVLAFPSEIKRVGEEAKIRLDAIGEEKLKSQSA